MKTEIKKKLDLLSEVEMAIQMVSGNPYMHGFLAYVGQSSEKGKVTALSIHFANRDKKDGRAYSVAKHKVADYTYNEFQTEFEFLGDDEINKILIQAKALAEDEAVSVFYPIREPHVDA